MKKQVCEGIYWVGANEWSKSHFHGHELSIKHGTTYNSFFIDDEKKVVIDSVRDSKCDEWFKNIEEFCKIEELDILIVDHAEPDHSTAIPRLLERNPNIQIYVSNGGKISVSRFFPMAVNNLKVVKTGDSIKIGKRTLKFFEAQMLHWPDTMFTYSDTDKVLFSADAFGEHLSTSKLFNDEIDNEGLWYEAEKYFANILTLYSQPILKKIDAFLQLNWELKMIAPSHGIIWRDNPTQIVEKYIHWAKGECEGKAVIIFDTIWGGTEKMADAIGQGLAERGVHYKIFNAGSADMADVMTDLLGAKAIIMGSATRNNTVLPVIAAFLEETKGLKFRNKIGAAFGTYGWSGECIKRIEAGFAESGIEVVAEGVKSQFSPDEKDLLKCKELGHTIADKIKCK